MKNTAQRRRLITKVAKPEQIYPVDEIEQKKPLYLVMQAIWFNAIENGSKTDEYREGTAYYKSRLCNIDKKTGKITSFKNYRTVILQEGYRPGARRMVVEIKGVTLKRDFTIHLGKIVERINFNRF